MEGIPIHDILASFMAHKAYKNNPLWYEASKKNNWTFKHNNTVVPYTYSFPYNKENFRILKFAWAVLINMLINVAH